ncbi:MAG: peptidase M16, partial [Pseudomonadales bacterium]|nr:peptidase M16 [Pseudomonadales bacterium]
NTDLEMLLKCNLLSDVLLDTSASPLRRALEESPLGTAVSPLAGLEEGNHEMSFMCGVEGSDPEHADAVESLILSTLERVATDGVAYDRLEAVLHQLELHQREVGGDGMPYGLQLIFSCMAAAVHRGDPIELLDLDPILEKLRQQIRDPEFIKQLVRELLLENPHRVRLTFYPDPELEKRKQAQDKARLAAIRDALSDAQREALVERARALQEHQNREEDLSVLPRFGLEDIPADIRLPEGETRATGGGARLTSYTAGTNGLVYHQVVTRLPAIESDLLPFLPLYTQIVSEVGTSRHDYLETQHLQHSATGGINVFTSVRSAPDQTDSVIGYLTFSSRTLNRKCRDMVGLLRETSLEARFDEDARLRELMGQIRARRQAGVTNNGHSYAMSAAAARFRPISWLNHELTGLAGL